MELEVQVEKSSNILRKLTVRVPASVVATRFEDGLGEIQRTAHLKGFRPGYAPISVVRQFYGEDVRHRLYHTLIDESYRQAVQEHQLRTVGHPEIDARSHKTGEGIHDHALKEGQDLVYTAIVEVYPEIEIKGYSGIALVRERVDVHDDQVQQVVDRLRESRAEMVPVMSGATAADGKPVNRFVQKGDYVDMDFSGGVVKEQGLEERPGMKGTRFLEVGSNTLIPGFEENLVGLCRGETKTFDVRFPDDFHDKDLAGKEAKFTATINEIKEKKLPELDDKFAKQVGYESLVDLQKKAYQHLLNERTHEVDQKLRSELIQALIDKNPIDMPKTLVESQVRVLAKEWADELKSRNIDEKTIKDAITNDLESLRKRAEAQVRASLLLEAVARKEGIEIDDEEFRAEVAQMAANMKIEERELNEFYAKTPGRKDDVLFRLRQERTIRFLLDKAKIKSKS